MELDQYISMFHYISIPMKNMIYGRGRQRGMIQLTRNHPFHNFSIGTFKKEVKPQYVHPQVLISSVFLWYVLLNMSFLFLKFLQPNKSPPSWNIFLRLSLVILVSKSSKCHKVKLEDQTVELGMSSAKRSTQCTSAQLLTSYVTPNRCRHTQLHSTSTTYL